MNLIDIAGFVLAAVVLLPLIGLLLQMAFLRPHRPSAPAKHRAAQPGRGRSRTAAANW